MTSVCGRRSRDRRKIMFSPSAKHTNKRRSDESQLTGRKQTKTHLLETNVVGVFTETLTAQVDSVLPDDTVLVSARPAAKKKVGRQLISCARQS